jgi:hypothetical protein
VKRSADEGRTAAGGDSSSVGLEELARSDL